MKNLLILLLVVLGLQLTSCVRKNCSSCDSTNTIESVDDSINTKIDFNASYGTYPRKIYSNGVVLMQETNRFKIYEHSARSGVWVEDKQLTTKLERIDSLLQVLNKQLESNSTNNLNNYSNGY